MAATRSTIRDFICHSIFLWARCMKFRSRARNRPSIAKSGIPKYLWSAKDFAYIQMSKIVDWDSHIGRRLRLRDLHAFFTVVQTGSLAKAAAALNVSQPAVSQLIIDLEHAVGVKLFDRSSRGVTPTV